MKWWNDPAVISKTPLAAIPFFCWFSLMQIVQMWREHTAAGQNLAGWLFLWVALLLFLNFYRVCCPRERSAYLGTWVEVTVVTSGMLTVAYFRYWAGG